jgi:hypothetical protein
MISVKNWVSFAKSTLLSLWRLKSKKGWRLAFNLLVFSIFGIFVYSRFSADWTKIKDQLVNVNPWNLLLVIMLYGVNFYLQFFVWNEIVRSFQGPAEWRLNAFLFASSHLAKFLPTPVWFIGARMHGYKNRGLSRKTTLVITGLEILLHFLSGLTLWTLLSIYSSGSIEWVIIAVAVLICTGVLMMKLKVLKLTDFLPELENATVELKDAFVWFIIYLLTWLIAAPFFWVIVRFFVTNNNGTPIFLWRVWVFSSLISYISTYTLGGIGVFREISLAWLLSKVYPMSVCLFIAAGARVFLTVGGILWGAVTYWVMRGYVRHSSSLSERS